PHPLVDVRGRRCSGGDFPAQGGQRARDVRARHRLRCAGAGLASPAPGDPAPRVRRCEVERTGLMLTPTPASQLAPRRIGARCFDFAHEVAVMAIINRTPDSFYDRGRTFELQAAVDSALAAVAAGADWVDIGGMGVSPDAEEISPSEEID